MEWIVCPRCGYHNKKRYVDTHGTCNLCDEILDRKAKFKYEMNKKLRLWRNKRK